MTTHAHRAHDRHEPEGVGMSDPMTCEVSKGTCPCSLVTATGGTCEVFGPPPTFAEAFPYLTTDPRATARETTEAEEGEHV